MSHICFSNLYFSILISSTLVFSNAVASFHADDQLPFALPTSTSSSTNHQLLVGSYGPSPLTLFSFDPSSYSLTNQSILSTAGTGASWASWDSTKSFLYSTNDHASSTLNQHAIHAFSSRKDLDGQIIGFDNLNVQKTRGDGTVMVRRSKFPDSKCLYTANYGGSSMSVISLSSDGSIDLSKKIVDFQFKGTGPVKDRQDRSYPHEAIDTPDGKYVYVPDLGADRIHAFALTSPSTCGLIQLSSIKADSGDGPRHMKFKKDDQVTYAYVVTELSGVIRSYSVDEKNGDLNLLKVQSVRPSKGLSKVEWDGIQPSEVIISPDGKFLYVALRHLPHTGSNGTPGDSIAIFNRSTTDGSLTGPISFYHTGGRNPRHFSISKDEAGAFLAVANQGDDDENGKGQRLTVLKRDFESGNLELIASLEVEGTAFAGFV